MNSNPFPQDFRSGEIKSLDQFDPNEPRVELDEAAQKILMNIPANQRVDYLATSTEPELADAREQLAEERKKAFRDFVDNKTK